ncbi:MAG: GTP-binding protein, partial [Spirochaetes bacterium]|nr:GTP-binding protein [Spirochaetota bacterium]
MIYDTKNIRNIALIGHGSSGKTTLNEAILFTGHNIPTMGRVDNGKSVSDYNDQEITKKISIHSSISYIEWNEILINIIDTPGAPDFVGEVIAAIRAADCAVFVINAGTGVEIETIKSWRKCDLPKLVFINKMHKDNADFKKCMTSLKENFKDKTFVPLTIPIGTGTNFKGIVDLIDREARYFEDEGKKIRREKAPDDIAGLDDYFTQMLETAVETDEELMNKYFDGKEISHDEIIKGLKDAIISGTIVPVICGDSLSNSGTSVLLDSIVNYMPSPVDIGSIPIKDKSDKEIMLEPDSNKPIALFIFKTSIDQFAGKISYFRIRRGQIKNDIELYNSNKNQKQKCGKLFKIIGKNLKDVDSL